MYRAKQENKVECIEQNRRTKQNIQRKLGEQSRIYREKQENKVEFIGKNRRTKQNIQRKIGEQSIIFREKMENRIKERKGIRFKKRKNEERFLKARKNEGSERKEKSIAFLKVD